MSLSLCIETLGPRLCAYAFDLGDAKLLTPDNIDPVRLGTLSGVIRKLKEAGEGRASIQAFMMGSSVYGSGYEGAAPARVIREKPEYAPEVMLAVSSYLTDGFL